MDCIFCQIADGTIPTKFVYQDDRVVVFSDIHPIASVHVLIIPREHIASLANVMEADLPLLGHMMGVAIKLAREKGIAETGYRVAINSGQHGTQIVPHLHMHLIGGRQLSGSLG